MRIVCIDGEAQYRDIVMRDVGEPLAAAGHQFDWFEESFADRDATIARAAGYDALYVVGDQGPVPAGLMDANPQLSLVSFVGTGARRFVAMDEASRNEVTVTNVPDFASQSVAEHALALMFAAARRIVEGDRLIREGRWEKNQGLKLAGRTLGVVGAGAIGARLIAMARGVGMDVVYWSRTPDADRDARLGARRVELAELFATSDVVSLHLTHTPETDGIITRELLTSMPDGAIFVNTARAELVDVDALAERIASGALFGAGIDVFVEEPPQPGGLPPVESNTILSAHVGFHTDEADDVFRIAGENILAFAAGAPVNVIV
ncbi:NAD(P)-dependent oxidoreductase [Microbacterium sp. M3]|uniref:NAD(P)-dependent oxidoreductase n=1 Tax=Microbacterium arthrosphaerae TaxID=792652 RepID=A0ABU4GY04_9MICO|nr:MULTISPECIES: NAD(P)-dependent oxidoreductase [Microbacterium]MDW4571962.1 NAD(P)-dependent oxidoreductase [Microbacterium arthrosphaerae]MDW7605817.1 NAD(P)-dependent oxidoreductase [Microbacterium sp. M3]